MKPIIITLCLCIAVLSFNSCNEKKEKECCKKKEGTELLPNKTLSDASIFNLESDWITQKNDTIQLLNLGNKITVASMVFTHCQSACPRLVADLKRIENSFSPEELAKIQFVLISMDPARDTPARFVEFANEHHLNENWICISSDADATMEIANVLNVRIKQLADGGFDHSNTIHLIDKKGNIAFQQNGLAENPDPIINEIKQYLSR